MQTKKRNGISGRLGTLFCMVSVAGWMASCEPFFEDLPPCPHGIALRFETDFNAESGSQNALNELVVVVYDADSNWVDTRYVEQQDLADGHFRLEMDVPQGLYHFVAYSGLRAESPSFAFVQTPGAGSRMADLRTALDRNCLSDSLRRNLTNFYWGYTSLHSADLYETGSLRLKRNTNNIRIMLQEPGIKSGTDGRFAYQIVDDNTLFNYRNDVLPCDTAHYQPWTAGTLYFDHTSDTNNGTGSKNSPAAYANQNAADYTIHYAELSTSRLIDGQGRLVVRDVAKGETLIDIPLTKYLEQAISENVGGSVQDYLDRENQYTLHFFLSEEGWWMMTYIIVNGWIVRINDVEF